MKDKEKFEEFINELKEEIKREILKKNEGRNMYFLELKGTEVLDIIDNLAREYLK